MKTTKSPNNICKLCLSNNLNRRYEIRTSLISEAYRTEFGIDIKAIGCSAPTGLISFFECQSCGLLQFTPDWVGPPSLYEALQQFPWYYQEDKNEFQVAKKFIRNGDAVLEIGCANGNFRQHLPSELVYYGLEFNQLAIQKAKKKGLNVEAKPLEIIATERAAEFDVACAFQVLEHIADPRAFLLDMIRSVKPGGLIIFSVPCEDSFLRFEGSNVTNLPPHHITRWQDKVFSYLPTILDLEVIDVVHEKLAHSHRRAYANAQIYRILGANRNGVAPALWGPIARRAVSFASLPVRFWKIICPSSTRGHTVTVILKRSRGD
jgi:2-polyprenyl-3-methyl-5-hydroxy-6-metoxy-1,4-benzoquinol methylase